MTLEATETSTQPARGAVRVPDITGRQFAIEAARILADTRCHAVAVLDVSAVSPITDYLVIATGTSDRQMKSACDAAQEYGEPLGHRAMFRSGDDTAQWIIMDFVDVVVHCFTQEARSYYDLDGLWGDAKVVAWEKD